MWVLFSDAVIHAFVATCFLKNERWFRLFNRSRFIRAGAYAVLAVAIVLCSLIVGAGAVVDYRYSRNLKPRGFAERSLQDFSKASATLSSAEHAHEPHTLKVLSFNVWAVEGWLPKFILNPSKDLEQRFQLMPAAIAETGADVVILQELWRTDRADRLRNELMKHGYVYSAMKTPSVMWNFGITNGLLIVSRFPLDPNIEAIVFNDSTRDDESLIFARKGVIKTRVSVDDQWVDVYATHLGGFSTEMKDGKAFNFVSSEQVSKAKQADQVANFIRQTHTSPSMVLAADLNTHPYVFHDGKYEAGTYAHEYSVLTCQTKLEGCVELKDSAAVVHPNEQASLYTYDSNHNVYVKRGHFSYEPPGRIDYIFSAGDLKVRDSEIVFKDTAISDHYGVLATYELPRK
jgi:endonuclease/exonuclease/phosphatase family metal-dependent hydrolase